MAFLKESENNFSGYFYIKFRIYATGIRRTDREDGAGAVIWMVGTQKLVRTLEDGFRRIREHSLPLENERTQQIYGQASAINKLLIVNGEAYPGRITIVLVKQQLGF